MNLAERYLDLLARSLTGTLHKPEPAREGVPFEDFAAAFHAHYIHNKEVCSCLPLARMQNIHGCVREALADGVPGDLIETGVWRGGATIFMRALLEAYEPDSARAVWVADSFEGLPRPDPESFPKEAAAHDSEVMVQELERLAVPLPKVQENFERYGLLDARVRFLKGWFKDSLPKAPIEKLAVLRLDGDYFESTWDALKHLYAKVSPGGFVIVDDYGEDGWTYCRQAVDSFREVEGISAPLISVDAACWYWRKAR